MLSLLMGFYLTSQLEDDLFMPGASFPRKYPPSLEGLQIEVCKYRKADKLQLTQDKFDAKVQKHTKKLESYAKQNEGRYLLDTLKRTAVESQVYRHRFATHKLWQVIVQFLMMHVLIFQLDYQAEPACQMQI